MTGDRLANSFRRVVHRVLADDTQNAPINFGRLHAARVVAANEDGVAVIFDDARLGSKTGVPLSSDPGLSLQVLVNTRVLVGWADGAASSRPSGWAMAGSGARSRRSPKSTCSPAPWCAPLAMCSASTTSLAEMRRSRLACFLV